MATYISNQTGLWSSASTWLTAAAGTLTPTAPAGDAPQSGGGDKFIIRAGHVVTYDVIGEFGDQTSTYVATSILTNVGSSNAITLSAGTLRASRKTNTELTARGNITIGVSGTFDWGTSADPITAANANITLHYMTQLSALSASQGAAGLYLMGGSGDNQPAYNNIYINGKNKLRNTILAVSAASGANVITVLNSTGWEVGDRLCIATDLISNRNSTINGILSSTIIQSITGNNITISPTLNTSKAAGTCLSNFTSNVNIRSFNPTYGSYGLYLYPNSVATIDINNIYIGSGVGTGITSPVGWMPYSYTGSRAAAAQTSSPIGNISMNISLCQLNPFRLKGIVFDNLTGHTQHYGFFMSGRFSELITLEDCAGYAPNSNSYFSQTNTQASVYYKNCNLYTGSYGVLMAGAVPNYTTFDNCNFDASVPIANQVFGLTFNAINCKIRGTSYITGLDTILKGTVKNSNIYHTFNAGSILQNNVNASGSLIFSNCNFYNGTTALSAVTKTTAGLTNKTSQTAEFGVYQANGNLFDYRRFNYYHYSQADLINRKRGITSYRIKPEVANTQFYNYFTIPATINTPQRIKGSLRFDSNYGSAYPPSISFVGAGVNTLCACDPAANTWQDFDVTLNPTSTDDITMTITCQSSSTSGFAWLDGLPIYPYIQDVRHYGFVFDKAIDRTVNTLNTLTENQVSGLVIVNNLDFLYDAASYWSVTNPASSSYVDLYTVNGAVLDFGSKNIVVNNTGSGFSYNSGTNTITLNSPVLSAGNNFNTLKTTGTITLNTGKISYIDINASVIQNTPTSLSGVYVLNSANTYVYNTNTPIEVEFNDCNVYGLQNNGTAIVTIKKTGTTTISESDAEIVTYAPTLINLTLQGGYIALYDNTGTRQYYQNSDGTIVLPAAATGIWTYKVARYGYELVAGSFTINQSTGGTVDINPTYVPDSFITESNATVVAAYTDLNTTAKIHDYVSYIRTTSAGIDYGTLHTQSFGTLTFNYGLTLDASAASIFNYSGGVITLKSSSITDDIVYFINGDFTQLNGNTVSDGVKVRADNLDSEFYFNNVDSLEFFPTENDRNNNTNVGPTITSETIYRFLYGSTVSGVTFSNYAYIRVTVAGTTLLNTTALSQGSNTIDFGTTGNIQVIISNQKVINAGVQKASKLIPHSTNI